MGRHTSGGRLAFVGLRTEDDEGCRSHWVVDHRRFVGCLSEENQAIGVKSSTGADLAVGVACFDDDGGNSGE